MCETQEHFEILNLYRKFIFGKQVQFLKVQVGFVYKSHGNGSGKPKTPEVPPLIKMQSRYYYVVTFLRCYTLRHFVKNNCR